MAEYTTPAPVLETAVRLSNGKIQYTWANKATSHTSYDKMYLHMRKEGAGSWPQANAFGYPTISNQKAQQTLLPAAYGGGKITFQDSWQISLIARSVKGGASPRSNVLTIKAEATPVPKFNSIERLSQAAVRVHFDPVSDGAGRTDAIYAYMREANTGQAFVQVNRTTSRSQKTLSISRLKGAALDGSKAYEVELDAGGPAGYSKRTTRKVAAAWWEIPDGVTNLLGEWGDKGIDLTWGATSEPQAPINSQEIWRADGSLGQFRRITTIAGTKRKHTDTTADQSEEYRYQVIPRSNAGLATQRPDVKVTAKTLAPVAPTNVQVEYVATDKIKVSWVRKDTPDRNYDSQRLIVRTEGSSAWVKQAPISGAAVTQTLDIGPNKVVEISVEATNAAGSTTSDPSRRVATTPARPSSLTSYWSGEDSITIEWSNEYSIADKYMLEFSNDGQAPWYPAPVEADLPASGGSWVHTVAPHSGKTYQLKAVMPSIPDTPDSSYIKSDALVPQTTPNPPTVLPPDVLDAREIIPLRIIHNPVDGKPQSKAQIRFKKQGGAFTTRSLTIGDLTEIAAGTFNNGDVLEVQARTAASTEEYSDWSTPILITLRARPEILSLTTSALTSRDVTGTWTASAQSSARAELLLDGLVVLDRTVGAGTRSVKWTDLTDQGNYSMRVVVRDQYQESLPATVAMPIELVRPGKPSGTAEFRIASGSVLVTATPGSSTSYMEAWRVDPDMLGFPHYVGLLSSNMIIDERAPLGRESLEYFIRAHGPAGGFINSDPILVDTSSACDIYLSFEGGLAIGGWDPAIGGTAGRESVAHRYVGDDEGPSFTWGQKLSRVLTTTVTIDESTGDSPLGVWIQAAEAGRVTYRDPSGKVMTGALTKFSFTDSSVLEQSVTFTIERGRK